jgi:hypothetical protein
MGMKVKEEGAAYAAEGVAMDQFREEFGTDTM